MGHFGHGNSDWHSGAVGHGGDGTQWMGVFLIPAPMAIFGTFVAFMFGATLGMMAGRKRAMMAGGMDMQDMAGMGGKSWDMGMGKMMMHKTRTHHHHGEGSPPCNCGEQSAHSETAVEGE